MHQNEILGVLRFVHDYLPSKTNEIFLNNIQRNLKQTFSRYCRKPTAPTNKTSVTPNAIPV